MEGDVLLGHICFYFLGLSAELMCVFLWQYRTMIIHIWKCKVKWSADTVAVCLWNTCGFDNWVEREKQPWHDYACMCICAGAKVQASTKDFLKLFSMHNKYEVSATCVSTVCVSPSNLDWNHILFLWRERPPTPLMNSTRFGCVCSLVWKVQK